MMDGFINLLKTPAMTSSDAVVFVRHCLPRGVKTGHGGTLDPDAAGVLPVCVGKATRLFDYIIDKEKEYIAEICLGIATDTLDATGTVLSRSAVSVTKEDILSVLPRFIGDIEQIPPMYSALKRDGQRLCDIARRGETLKIEKRPVTVNNIEYLAQTAQNRHLLRITCRKGVYIRTLCSDIGAALGCGAHMAFLLRSKSGVFDSQNAFTVEEILQGKDDMSQFLTALDVPLAQYPKVVFGSDLLPYAKNGNPLPQDKALFVENASAPTVRVYIEDAFAGMAQPDESGLYRFRAMLL